MVWGKAIDLILSGNGRNDGGGSGTWKPAGVKWGPRFSFVCVCLREAVSVALRKSLAWVRDVRGVGLFCSLEMDAMMSSRIGYG